MIVLRTLGGLALESEAAPLAPGANQRSRLALLAVLAAAGERGVSREKLLGYFWPERDTEHGRNALNQILFSIRRDLLSEEVVAGTRELRLNPALIGSDVADFQCAFGRSEWERAAELYRGRFLDGFYLRGAAEFERWVEVERTRLADQYRTAVEALATAAGERGDHAAAVRWWRKLAADDPLGTRGAVGLIRSLDSSGDKPGALQHARVYEALVRQELESDPDPAVTALCAEIRERKGSEVHSQAAAPPARIVRSEPPTSPTPPALPHPAPATDLSSVVERVTTTPASSGRPWPRRLVIGAAAVVLLVGMIWSRRPLQKSTLGTALDANRIVVLPFRVTTDDSSLSYLSEGLADLLAATLTGEGGPVAVDPRTTLALWHRALTASGAGTGADTSGGADAGVRVAQAAGAGLLLRGEIVGTGGVQLVLHGAVVGVTDGQVRARATVQGRRDSVPALVHGLAAELLALAAGEDVQRLGQLTNTSLPALRAYLEGRSAHRRGDDGAAIAQLSRALQLDSTLAVAALELAASAGPIFKWAIWLDSSIVSYGHPSALGGIPRADDDRVTWAMDRAWRERTRLSDSDRAYLTALRGENYPQPTSAGRLLVGWEQATRVAPGRADVWYPVGHILLTQGTTLGMTGAWERAASVFRRARELDTAFVAPIAGLLEIAALRRDRDDVRRLAAEYLARDSTSERAHYIRWRVAAVSADTVALRALRQRFDTFGLATLDGIQRTSQLDGGPIEDAERATEVMLRRAAGRQQRRGALFTACQLALNRGRPRDALRLLKLKLEVEGTPDVYLAQSINFALHWDGDPSAGESAARQLDSNARRVAMSAHATSVQRRAALWGLVPLTRWRLWRGDTATANLLLMRLHHADPTDTVADQGIRTAMLEAEVAVVEHRANALQLVDQLDARARDGCCSTPHLNLVVARLREMTGDVPGALRAVRRGRWASPWYLSTHLREEGRLAALTGDREGAIRAYRHFLILRSDPEPSLAVETEDVRRELRRLDPRAE
ncbi:MAG: hypothetical protein NVS1B4_25210 [Gemmatimonadaceae bacterium]